jgi:4-carboxymuconolactone decarboxylase
MLDEHVPFLEGIGVQQHLDPLASSQLSAAVLGFDAARPAPRSGRRSLFFQAAENFLHVASRPMNGRDSIDCTARPDPPLCGLFSTGVAGQNCRGFDNTKSEEEPMAESELYRKGAALRRELLGDAAVERSARELYSDPVMKKFIDVATETVFGALWTRPGLDLKTRALICVVSDAATGREPELGLHLRMALRQGWGEEELTEVLLHLSGYVGVPIIRESMMVASRVFA